MRSGPHPSPSFHGRKPATSLMTPTTRPPSSAKRSAAADATTASTSAYSGIVCPALRRKTDIARLIVRLILSPFPVCGLPVSCGAAALRKQRRHVVDRLGDATREGGEGDDRAERDHGENDAVLGHRLALLLPPVLPEVIEPPGNEHVVIHL